VRRFLYNIAVVLPHKINEILLRQPPQLNYPPDTVPLPDSRNEVRIKNIKGWYLTF